MKIRINQGRVEMKRFFFSRPQSIGHHIAGTTFETFVFKHCIEGVWYSFRDLEILLYKNFSYERLEATLDEVFKMLPKAPGNGWRRLDDEGGARIYKIRVRES